MSTRFDLICLIFWAWSFYFLELVHNPFAWNAQIYSGLLLHASSKKYLEPTQRQTSKRTNLSNDQDPNLHMLGPRSLFME